MCVYARLCMRVCVCESETSREVMRLQGVKIKKVEDFKLLGVNNPEQRRERKRN